MTELTGPIRARTPGRGRTSDRRASRLDTVWLMRRHNAEHYDTALSSDVLVQDPHSPVMVSSDEPMLVALSDEVSAVTATASAAIEAGRRVYGLTPAGWPGNIAPDWLAGASSTSVLFRRVRDAPMAAVICGGEGWLWLGAGGPGSWRVTLDTEQVAAARQVFLELYWNQADDEAWPADGGLQWHARGDPPFDLPRTVPQATVRLERTGAQHLTPAASGSVYFPDGSVPEGFGRRLWLPPSGNEHARLADAVRAGTDVGWTDLGLPACTTGECPVMNAATGRWSLRITLTPSQGAVLTQLLERDPDAVFRTACPLGEVQAWLGPGGRVWLAGRNEPDSLIHEQKLDAGAVPAASLRDVPNTEPESWPEPGPLALSAHWSWQVSPPQAPDGATEDPLVQKWRQIDDRYAADATSAQATLTRIETKEGTLGRAFATLAGPLLGFKSQRRRLEAELRECVAATPSMAGPAGVGDLLDQLAKTAEEVKRLDDEIADAERKEADKIERKRQQVEHARTQDNARKALTRHTGELDRKQQRLGEIETELGELAANSSRTEAKGRQVTRGKLRDERNRLEKQIRQLEQQVEQDRADIDRPFEHRVSPVASGTKRKATFIPPTSDLAQRTIPVEAPPAVGRLLRAGKDRLLAISQWNELGEGESEADRLGARLVAIVEEA
jgi:predicted  nucleic acid-binding Zn-ribbon protein